MFRAPVVVCLVSEGYTKHKTLLNRSVNSNFNRIP
jgi:hypothetical protein